jgi:hypothetical protein
MKAELDKEGTLRVTPESSVEQFALRHWLSLWQDDKAYFNVDCEAVIAQKSEEQPNG